MQMQCFLLILARLMFPTISLILWLNQLSSFWWTYKSPSWRGTVEPHAYLSSSLQRKIVQGPHVGTGFWAMMMILPPIRTIRNTKWWWRCAWGETHQVSSPMCSLGWWPQASASQGRRTVVTFCFWDQRSQMRRQDLVVFSYHLRLLTFSSICVCSSSCLRG